MKLGEDVLMEIFIIIFLIMFDLMEYDDYIAQQDYYIDAIGYSWDKNYKIGEI